MIEKITDPRLSIWINSSAGCGKTTLLIKRVLSLLLSKKTNILCITFTKVAAAEMYNRIFDILGKIAVMSDEKIAEYIYSNLKRKITDFDYARKLIYTADSFIQIQTLHSFCWQSIKICDPQYISKRIYEENKYTFSKLLLRFICEKCQLPQRTAESLTEQNLYEILSSLMDDFHLNYAEIIEKLENTTLEGLPVNTLGILSTFAQFLEINRDISENYISYSGIIETAINKQIWNIYEVATRIEHILLDEAQDNNLKQWYIFTQLCSDFLINEVDNRSIFVVGDYKQSIYGFQGANPDMYLAFYDILKQRDPTNKLTSLTIEKSYRSSVPILKFVDSTFENTSFCATFRDKIHHTTNRTEAAGYIEVMPLVEKNEIDAELQLAILIKERIHTWLTKERTIEAKERPVRASDILILVAHRTNFIDHLHTQLTAVNIPVKFTGRFSIKNSPLFELLITLGKFLTYKHDDESLIKILKSPIFRWKDPDLLKIKATDKEVSLFSHLEKTKTGTILQNWLRVYGTTFEIYSQILNEKVTTPLIEHFGNETSYYIDIFLDNTLEHDCIYDFIHIFTGKDASLKIKSCNKNGITISTVHGSKGTQYPIVFVADSNYVPQNRDIFFFTKDGIPILSSEKNLEIVKKNKDSKRESMQQEHLRLLYVALTRAEDELYIVGTGKMKKHSWHEMCTQGIMKIGSVKGDGSYYYTNHSDYLSILEGGIAGKSLLVDSKLTKKDTLETSLTQRKQKIEPNLADLTENLLSNSSSTENQLGNPSRKTFEMLRGELIHKILEYIFTIKNPEKWISLFLEEYSPELKQEEKNEIKNTVLTFIRESSRAPCKKEVEICFEGMLLRIDSLEFKGDTVIIRDYKTGKERSFTATVEEQLSLYKKAIQAIHPEKTVITEMVSLS